MKWRWNTVATRKASGPWISGRYVTRLHSSQSYQKPDMKLQFVPPKNDLICRFTYCWVCSSMLAELSQPYCEGGCMGTDDDCLSRSFRLDRGCVNPTLCQSSRSRSLGPASLSYLYLSTQTVTLGEHDVRKSCDCKSGVCNPRHQGWTDSSLHYRLSMVGFRYS